MFKIFKPIGYGQCELTWFGLFLCFFIPFCVSFAISTWLR